VAAGTGWMARKRTQNLCWQLLSLMKSNGAYCMAVRLSFHVHGFGGAICSPMHAGGGRRQAVAFLACSAPAALLLSTEICPP
jgi:hypothetical protein